LQSLTQKLVGKEVEILYPDCWTLLDPMGKLKHISGCIDGEILCDELEEN